MGLAIIVPDIAFHNALGAVTQTGGRDLKALEILNASAYTAPSVKLRARLVPLSATSRSLIWSVESGGSYAEITDGDVLSIKPSASGSSVTVKVVSADNPNIYATKQITVTYDYPVTILDKVSIANNPTLNTGIRLTSASQSIEIRYKITGTRGSNAFLWGTINEWSGAYFTSDGFTIVDFGANNDRNPFTKGSIITYNGASQWNAEYVDEFFVNKSTRNGELLTPTTSYSHDGFEDAGDIYILHPNSSYKFTGIDIYYFAKKESGVVVAEFLPAKKNNICGFYCPQTHTFITNSGTSGTITE